MNENEVLAFVRQAVRSVWALELLLLLRNDPAKAWHIADLVAAQRANTRLVKDSLSTLQTGGLVLMDDQGRYHYGPASAALGEAVEALADIYRQKPVMVVREIFATPNDKAQSFANAFRFKQ